MIQIAFKQTIAAPQAYDRLTFGYSVLLSLIRFVVVGSKVLYLTSIL
jgi:hypothetical protein